MLRIANAPTRELRQRTQVFGRRDVAGGCQLCRKYESHIPDAFWDKIEREEQEALAAFERGDIPEFNSIEEMNQWILDHDYELEGYNG